MAVPAHDERDFEFARKFELPIVEVVSPDGALHDAVGAAFTGEGIAVRSGQFDGLPSDEMRRRIVDFLEAQGIGRRKVNYKLRDWIFSRQRYWGEPIPIYFPVETDGDPRSGAAYRIDYSTPIPCDDSELPLLLPELDDYHPGDPQGPLARALDWRFFRKDGRWYARETNTMPQWAGSCWYYLRYLDPHDDREIFSRASYDAWMPVDLYVGGAEHAVLHLLYARFWHKVLFDAGVVKHPEPFLKLVHQGMILGMAYRWYAVLNADGRLVRALDGDAPEVERDPEKGDFRLPGGERVEERFVVEADVEWRDGKPLHREHAVRLAAIAEKMSKSRGNVVNPDDVVRDFGADSLRVYEMFMGPLEQVKPWQTQGIQGVRRFLDRVHAIGTRELAPEPMSDETARLVHRTIQKVGADIEALRFNTAVSAMMTLAKHLHALSRPPREAVELLVLVLSPFAPHLCEEMWERIGNTPSIANAAWPAHDPAKCIDDEVEIAVQVNGKVRGTIRLARDASEASARAAGLEDANVQKHVAGKAIKKCVYVPGRILNLIVG
jgi:leucyl-tRNA synthetase